MTATQTYVQRIPLDQLTLSNTGSQAERRARFSDESLDELAQSIKAHGLLQPIVARYKGDKFEVVAGERRVLASRKAGADDILVNVRDLTDEQVIEVQLIENLQREDLHALAEAEGYEALLNQHHYTIDQLVAKVSKSRAYVYARLKLLDLCPAARKAFNENKLHPSVALLIARIPADKLQEDALQEILDARGNAGGGMSARAAAAHIQENYMLRLADAGFKTSDPDLVPGAGSCAACPKRTGNQPELFGDVKGADICTDPICFKAKRAASNKQKLAAAVAVGKTVIDGAAAQKLQTWSGSDDLRGFVKLSDKCWEDTKGRTVREILGAGAETTLVHLPKLDKVVEVVSEAQLKTALKAKGISKAISSSSVDRSAEKKARIEAEARMKILRAAADKMPKTLAAEDLRIVARSAWSRTWHDGRRLLCKFYEWEPIEKKSYGRVEKDYSGAGEKQIDGMTPAELARFLLVTAAAGDLIVNNYSSAQPDVINGFAKRFGVNAKKIRADLAAAAKKAKSKTTTTKA